MNRGYDTPSGPAGNPLEPALTATARCVCCDLPTESCGRDVERRRAAELKAERERLLELPGVIPARFASGCARCSEHVAAGDPIRLANGYGWTGLLCCGELAP